MAYTTIDDPSAFFQVETYTGAGANTSVTFSGNSDLKPDFLWIKNRGAAYGNFVVDSNRNISYAQNSSNAPYLETESTAVENNNQNWMQSVNTDGFTTGISEHINSNSGSSFVAWAWKAAGGTTTNQTGANIDSVTQANTTAGFSIVTYTGNGGTGQSVKHGLGTTPKMIWVKRRDGAGDWFVYHSALGNTKHLHLNTTAAVATTSDFGNYGPDATSFFVNNTGTCVNNETYVAYCFAEVQGYSKIGKYKGNENANGTFVYTGFKPAFILSKNSGVVTNWRILDNKRLGYNKDNNRLSCNTTAAEQTDDQLDILSNGFKLRTNDSEINSGYTHIYMAFAENPFVTSTGIPTTAR